MVNLMLQPFYYYRKGFNTHWVRGWVRKELRYSDDSEDSGKIGIIKWKQKAYQSSV
jgi:hypothetical protein